MPVIAGATKFQPVYVGDVADAVMLALTRPDTAGRIYELGGPQVLTFRELLTWILTQTRRNRMMLDVPMWIAAVQARLLENLPGRMLTRDQLLLLSEDNVVSKGGLGLADLGIAPTPIELIVPQYLARYRQGGAKPAVFAG
jgi:NADH dehydrogenase